MRSNRSIVSKVAVNSVFIMVRFFVPVFHIELDGSTQGGFLRMLFGLSSGSVWVFLRTGWFFQDLIWSFEGFGLSS